MNHRLTEIEGQAHSEALRHFAARLKEFPHNRELVKRLEQDIAKIALAAMAVSSKPANGIPVVADDGSQWFKSLDLFENVFVCHRGTPIGLEYAVGEQLSSGTTEMWAKGRNVVEVLKTFTHDQRRALQAWTEEMAAQVREFLALQYPGEDLKRVADTLMWQFTHDKNSADARPLVHHKAAGALKR